MHTKLTPSRGLFYCPRARTLVEALQSLQISQVRNYTTFIVERRGGNPRASGSKLEHT